MAFIKVFDRYFNWTSQNVEKIVPIEINTCRVYYFSASSVSTGFVSREQLVDYSAEEVVAMIEGEDSQDSIDYRKRPQDKR